MLIRVWELAARRRWTFRAKCAQQGLKLSGKSDRDLLRLFFLVSRQLDRRRFTQHSARRSSKPESATCVLRQRQAQEFKTPRSRPKSQQSTSTCAQVHRTADERPSRSSRVFVEGTPQTTGEETPSRRLLVNEARPGPGCSGHDHRHHYILASTQAVVLARVRRITRRRRPLGEQRARGKESATSVVIIERTRPSKLPEAGAIAKACEPFPIETC